MESILDTVSETAQVWRVDSADRDRLAWRVRACLRMRICDIRRISIRVIGSTAEIRGRISSQHEKHVCLECCRHVPGVTHVIDELIVGDELDPAQPDDFCSISNQDLRVLLGDKAC